MKKSRMSAFLCACVLVVFSSVLQAENPQGKDYGESVAQAMPGHNPSVDNNLDIHVLNRWPVEGLINLGFLIGCGVIGYVMLRKANAG